MVLAFPVSNINWYLPIMGLETTRNTEEFLKCLENFLGKKKKSCLLLV